jgi:hypothetical protein
MKFSLKTIFFLVGIVFFVTLELRAQTEKSVISVQSTVDKSTITIGDRITYTLMVEADPQVKIEKLPYGANLGFFEVKDYKTYEPQKTKEGRIIIKSEYIITTFTTGDYVIPPLPIIYFDPLGKREQINSESIFIKVKSVGATASDKDDIRPLKPPIDIPGQKTWLYVLIGLLVFALAGGYGYFRLKTKGIKLKEIPEELKKPAWEVALNELEQLRNSPLVKKGKIKEYYITLSEIIRKYLERRYEILALDRTSEEIKQEMKRRKIESEVYNLINQFLQSCDLVKFAKYIPSLEEIEKNWEEGYNIIVLSKPKEEAVLETQNIKA